MAFSFRGGIHPNSSKSATNQKPIEIMPAPNIVILPVSMHIGAPCRVLVNVSDTVDLGQPIAEPVGFVSAPVHATVSGKGIAVEPRLHPNGSKVLSVVIENDFEDRLHSSVTPLDFDHMTNDERIEAIQNGGIVGHGGATFPGQFAGGHFTAGNGIDKLFFRPLGIFAFQRSERQFRNAGAKSDDFRKNIFFGVFDPDIRLFYA